MAGNKLKKRPSRKKDIMNEVVSHFSNESGNCKKLSHKICWIRYFETGYLPFTPAELHRSLYQIIDSDGMRPRGKKLLSLRRKYGFTPNPDKTPNRPEEALERFIVATNRTHAFNQIPIGGKKESIDLLIKTEKHEAEFVELKAWTGNDSPLYALVESLKNLVEYRVILNNKIADVPVLDKVHLTVLAPRDYFNSFSLDMTDAEYQHRAEMAQELLKQIADEFDTTIAFKSLQLSSEKFKRHCALLYDCHKPSKKEQIFVDKDYSIPELKYDNWVTLVSS